MNNLKSNDHEDLKHYSYPLSINMSSSNKFEKYVNIMSVFKCLNHKLNHKYKHKGHLPVGCPIPIPSRAKNSFLTEVSTFTIWDDKVVIRDKYSSYLRELTHKINDLLNKYNVGYDIDIIKYNVSCEKIYVYIKNVCDFDNTNEHVVVKFSYNGTKKRMKLPTRLYFDNVCKKICKKFVGRYVDSELLFTNFKKYVSSNTNEYVVLKMSRSIPENKIDLRDNYIKYRKYYISQFVDKINKNGITIIDFNIDKDKKSNKWYVFAEVEPNGINNHSDYDDTDSSSYSNTSDFNYSSYSDTSDFSLSS